MTLIVFVGFPRMPYTFLSPTTLWVTAVECRFIQHVTWSP